MNKKILIVDKHDTEALREQEQVFLKAIQRFISVKEDGRDRKKQGRGRERKTKNKEEGGKGRRKNIVFHLVKLVVSDSLVPHWTRR